VKSRALAFALSGAVILAVSGVGPLAAASDPSANPAARTVLPGITARFSAPQAAPGAELLLEVAIQNGNQAPLTNVGFSLTLSPGLYVSARPRPFCDGTWAYGRGILTLSGATVANPSCGDWIHIRIMPEATPGSQTLTTSTVTSDIGASLDYASATIAILNEPFVTMSASKASAAVGAPGNLLITITNSTNSIAMTNYEFEVTLATGIKVTKLDSSACGGTVDLILDHWIMAHSLTVPSGSSCQVSAQVTGGSVGGQVGTLVGTELWPAAHITAVLTEAAVPTPEATATPHDSAAAASSPSESAPTSFDASGSGTPYESETPAPSPPIAPAAPSGSDFGSLPGLLLAIVALALVAGGLGAFLRHRRMVARGVPTQPE
jgi:hypothetical protein